MARHARLTGLTGLTGVTGLTGLLGDELAHRLELTVIRKCPAEADFRDQPPPLDLRLATNPHP